MKRALPYTLVRSISGSNCRMLAGSKRHRVDGNNGLTTDGAQLSGANGFLVPMVPSNAMKLAGNVLPDVVSLFSAALIDDFENRRCPPYSGSSFVKVPTIIAFHRSFARSPNPTAPL